VIAQTEQQYLKYFFSDNSKTGMQSESFIISREFWRMRASTSVPTQDSFEEKSQKELAKRLTPADYSEAGIVKSYDWSVKERETHDKKWGSIDSTS
jgi:hypothetical protein